MKDMETDRGQADTGKFRLENGEIIGRGPSRKRLWPEATRVPIVPQYAD